MESKWAHEKIFNITNYQGIVKMRYHYTTARLSKIKYSLLIV